LIERFIERAYFLLRWVNKIRWDQIADIKFQLRRFQWESTCSWKPSTTLQ
jgi:hypothetical protein